MREIEQVFGGGEGLGVVLEERDNENRGSFDKLGGTKRGVHGEGYGLTLNYMCCMHLYRL